MQPSTARTLSLERPVLQNRLFIPKQAAFDSIDAVAAERLAELLASGIIASVDDHLLRDDLVAVSSAIGGDVISAIAVLRQRDLFSVHDSSNLVLAPDTCVDLPPRPRRRMPLVAVAARHLIYRRAPSRRRDLIRLRYVDGAVLWTSSSRLARRASEQMARSAKSSVTDVSQFARSAHYLGSKAMLSAALVETVAAVTPPGGVVVDLMCGSGAASAAFARHWETLASDAQRFSRTLAHVQGGGFTATRAARAMDVLLPLARKHAASLREMVGDCVDAEDELMHADLSRDELYASYVKFVAQVPLYGRGIASASWDPDNAVRLRRDAPRLVPYALFTAYFANIFFGIRQAIEIDSLRYAIEQLPLAEREWCMGALVATVSRVATSYGGHFAQPRSIKLESVASIVETRAMPVMQEFTVRLMNLAYESERCKYEIVSIEGPWRDALARVGRRFRERKVCVYFDPPYTREPFSRYYHVLETLVKYDYPQCTGKGRQPNVRQGERFRSEFETRRESAVTAATGDVIEAIIERGWSCVWSYSNTGRADVRAALERVTDRVRCSVTSVAVPHTYKGQGGHAPREVWEYIFTIVPRRGR